MQSRRGSVRSAGRAPRETGGNSRRHPNARTRGQDRLRRELHLEDRERTHYPVAGDAAADRGSLWARPVVHMSSVRHARWQSHADSAAASARRRRQEPQPWLATLRSSSPVRRTLLRMITIDAARALRLDHRIGASGRSSISPRASPSTPRRRMCGTSSPRGSGSFGPGSRTWSIAPKSLPGRERRRRARWGALTSPPMAAVRIDGRAEWAGRLLERSAR